ncbi:hypothetical protein GCM10010329_70610 [Streptomyces spiroverticillatus]|uniref:Uncharacterized protein n=1 Tax=Streptomyces finlayi TaxID=67296 RepID=A0A918X0Y7_9ACTN|nr:hypothetical protein GCM10010329_70610 [Streptomyces spiroverticillatus]GHD01477.1 hypothetical protein GCM10010334_47190 [Streptomyces finlayi]
MAVPMKLATATRRSFSGLSAGVPAVAGGAVFVVRGSSFTTGRVSVGVWGSQ